MNKKDFVSSVVIGFLIALFFLPISSNVGIQMPFLWSVLILFPVLSVLGIAIASFLGRFVPVLFQLAKFLLVGGLNTFIDLGVLNILISLTGAASGIAYSFFKAISFFIAVLNSYFWSRRWTFEGRKKEVGKEFSQFFLVSIIGFFLNVGSASFVVAFISPLFPISGISENLWANIGAATAAFVSLSWNFIGYKLFVFKQ